MFDYRTAGILEEKIVLGKENFFLPCLFFFCSENVNIILIPNRNSIIFFNLQTSTVILNIRKKKKTEVCLENVVLSRAHIVKTAYIFCGFNDGTIVIWKLNWKKKKS